MSSPVTKAGARASRRSQPYAATAHKSPQLDVRTQASCRRHVLPRRGNGIARAAVVPPTAGSVRVAAARVPSGRTASRRATVFFPHPGKTKRNSCFGLEEQVACLGLDDPFPPGPFYSTASSEKREPTQVQMRRHEYLRGTVSPVAAQCWPRSHRIAPPKRQSLLGVEHCRWRDKGQSRSTCSSCHSWGGGGIVREVRRRHGTLVVTVLLRS